MTRSNQEGQAGSWLRYGRAAAAAAAAADAAAAAAVREAAKQRSSDGRRGRRVRGGRGGRGGGRQHLVCCCDVIFFDNMFPLYWPACLRGRPVYVAAAAGWSHSLPALAAASASLQATSSVQCQSNCFSRAKRPEPTTQREGPGQVAAFRDTFYSAESLLTLESQFNRPGAATVRGTAAHQAPHPGMHSNPARAQLRMEESHSALYTHNLVITVLQDD